MAATLTLKHDANTRNNTVNNTQFAYWSAGQRRFLVEVVRRGGKHTRIRRSLKGNGPTFLTESIRLSGFHRQQEGN